MAYSRSSVTLIGEKVRSVSTSTRGLAAISDTRHRHRLASVVVLAAIPSACGITSAEPSSLEATLRPVVIEHMQKIKVPGLVVSVQTPDRGSWRAALGVDDTATQAPMDVANHMRVGSIIKSFTATVILQLAQEGKLALDDPLAPYFPGFDTNGLGHNGQISGFMSQAARRESDGTIIVVLTNLTMAPDTSEPAPV
jgi:CubicO group peptidase (beta-lactamase class C family)